MATNKTKAPLHIEMVNKWRDSLNPLRSITMTHIVSHLESGERGEYADLQWLYRMIEKRDATLRALIELRESAIGKLQWNIKCVPEDNLPPGASVKTADAQATALRTQYELIDNLNESFKFIALASFRGFSHLEKHYNPDWSVSHLEFVEQWHWVREGHKGTWLYDKEARSNKAAAVPIDTANFIIRETPRPINEIALISFMRKNLSQKDWDGFVETYGIPPVFVVMPENVPAEKQAEYQALAEAVISDMRGTLPNGADIKTPDAGSRNHPFENHLKYQDQQLVLAGTSGKLTMLTESGSGTLAGNAHSDTFDAIAQAEALAISEIFQTQFDSPVLDRLFPNQPHLAYFELAAPDEDNINEVVTHASDLRNAGYAIAIEDLEERTGYTLVEAPLISRNPTNRTLPEGRATLPARSAFAKALDSSGSRAASLHNRETASTGDAATVADRLSTASINAVAQAQHNALAPLRERISQIAAIADATYRANALKNFRNELPKMLKDLNEQIETAPVIEQAISAGLINGYVEAAVKHQEAAA
jgi:phage gp29-like protein